MCLKRKMDIILLDKMKELETMSIEKQHSLFWQCYDYLKVLKEKLEDDKPTYKQILKFAKKINDNLSLGVHLPELTYS